jgi:hypothetical protein
MSEPKILIEGATFLQVGKAPSQLERIAMQVYQSRGLSLKDSIENAKAMIEILNLAELENSDEWKKKNNKELL